MTLPLFVIIAHFVGDWLLQSNWMALNKSKHWDVLAIHVTVYSACFAFWTPWQFIVITWIAHFVTDAITSRITSWLWFIELYPRPEKDIYPGSYKEFMKGTGESYYGAYTHFAYFKNTRHWFFAMIGLDQLIHYITLAYTWNYVYTVLRISG